MVGRRRNQRDPRNGVACLGNHIVHFESRKLSAFTRFGSLSYFNLYFISINQIFSGDTKASGSYLFDGASHGSSVRQRVETGSVFTTFPCVAASMDGVHGNCHRFVGFLADRTERHGTRHKTSEDILYRFHSVDRDRIATETQEITQKNRTLLIVCQMSELFEFLVAA